MIITQSRIVLRQEDTEKYNYTQDSSVKSESAGENSIVKWFGQI